MKPPGRARGDRRPHGSADGPPKRKRRRAESVAHVCHMEHRIAAGFKPQSPKLQALLERVWPVLIEAVEEREPDRESAAAFSHAVAMLEGSAALDEDLLYEIIGRLVKAYKGWKQRRQRRKDIAAVQAKRRERAVARAGKAKTTGGQRRAMALAKRVGVSGGFGGKREAFNPQAPALIELLSHAWPATMTEDGGAEVHLIPYSAFNAEDILPLLEGPVGSTYYRIEQPDEPVMLFAFNEDRLACWATDEPGRFLGFDPRDQIVYEDWEGTFEANEMGEAVRITLGGEESKSAGALGREFDKKFKEALDLLGLRYDPAPTENVGAWSEPVWDIKPVGEGWHRLISDRHTNLKIATTRSLWTSVPLYQAISRHVAAADNGQITQDEAERRMLKDVKRHLRSSGALETAFMKIKSNDLAQQMIRAVDRKDKAALRNLLVRDNFATKRLGSSAIKTVEVIMGDWDKDDADVLVGDWGYNRNAAIQKANSWQGNFGIKIDGGTNGKAMGVTAQVSNKGGVYTILFRDRMGKPSKPPHAARTESLDEDDAAVRRVERDLKANLGDLRAWERAYVVALRHGKHVAVVTKENGRSMMFGTNGPGSGLDKRSPLPGQTTLNFANTPASTKKQWFIFDADNGSSLLDGLRRRGFKEVWIGDGEPNPYGRLSEDIRADVRRPRKPGQGLTRIYGGFRFQVGKNQERKPRKDIGRALQNRLNARRGLGKRIKKAKEWHRSHKGAEMHRDLGRYNRTRMRETIADVRERIARWTAEYQQKGYIGETEVGAYTHGYAPMSDQGKSLDDIFEALLRRLIVAEALDVLQDVEFDDDTGALYLFFDPSLPAEETDELVRLLQAEESSLALIASPDRSLPDETVDSEWWVAYLPGKGEDGQPSAPDSRVYAATPEPGSKVQMVTMAPPTPVEQIALDVDVGKLLKSMGGK